MLYKLVVALSIAGASACDQVAGAQCYVENLPSCTGTGDSCKKEVCDWLSSAATCIGQKGCCEDTAIKLGFGIITSSFAEYNCDASCVDAAPCFARDTMADLADGTRLPMSDVTAGDYVLPGPTRVIVNQHKNAAHLQSSLLKVDHAEGSISLTADHVLNVDGSFVAAREATVGSKLGNSEVSRVTRTTGGIINPITTSGKINADGVLASTYPEWIAGYMLGRSTASASSLISFLFPATTQAYYDAALEQFFQSTSSSLVQLKAVLPAPLVALVFVVADMAIAAGFVAFSLASLKSVVAIAAMAAALQSRK